MYHVMCFLFFVMSIVHTPFGTGVVVQQLRRYLFVVNRHCVLNHHMILSKIASRGK